MSNELIPYTPDQVTLIKNIAAPKCTDDEFKLLLYQARIYKLDPLLKQIWAVKYQNDRPASIFAGRDGFLAIAHRSGMFDGMESGSRMDGTELVGWAKVYRKDMSHPFCVEVKAKEYNRGMGTWTTHPATMIQKVAEAQALRRAFSISGIYSPEEMPEPEKPPMRDITPPEEKKKGSKPPMHIHTKGTPMTMLDVDDAAVDPQK
jgi:phage recombination protein Bet